MAEFYQAFRPQVGRPRKYKPKELLEKFEEYLAWVKANPVEVETEFRAQKQRANDNKLAEKGATLRKQRLFRPVSIRGFLVHIGFTRQGWDDLDKGRYAAEYSAVKSFIKGYCEQNQLVGAMLGIYNGNIVSRLLGLKEEVEHSGKMEVTAQSREDLLAELERLEKLSK